MNKILTTIASVVGMQLLLEETRGTMEHVMLYIWFFPLFVNVHNDVFIVC